MLDSPHSRRDIWRILAGGAALAASGGRGVAGEARIEHLIAQARSFPQISQRIEFISRALRGTRYGEYTLIGGPKKPEQFVVRDDAFDCVTFCETVLAAAIAGNVEEFEQALRAIRYHNGVVAWRERNHYFFEWSRHNIENKICRPIVMEGAVAVDKTVFWHRELGKKQFSMVVIPREIFLANQPMLANGDIVGFVTRRPNLDYFHVGFLVFGGKGELLLRHAAQSRHRVLDERMDRFCAFNRVHYVTLLRPEEPPAASVSARKAI